MRERPGPIARSFGSLTADPGVAEFDPCPVPYFGGDWLCMKLFPRSLSFGWFKKGCCQLQAKVCRCEMTLAVDWDLKSHQQKNNTWDLVLTAYAEKPMLTYLEGPGVLKKRDRHHLYITYIMSSKGCGQTAQMCRLIWFFIAWLVIKISLCKPI